MKTRSQDVRLLLSIISILVLTGCQGTGQTVNFNPHAISSPPSKTATVDEESLTIVVEPFKDARPQKKRLGSRTHLWGGTTTFNAWNGNISEGMATLAVEYLQQRHWHASRTDNATQTSPTSDVTLTGTILSLNANAKSGLGFTDITIDMRVRFEAKNNADGSTVRMVLGAEGSDTVAVFTPQDVEQLLNLVTDDLYKQLFQDLTVKNKALHLQSAFRP